MRPSSLDTSVSKTVIFIGLAPLMPSSLEHSSCAEGMASSAAQLTWMVMYEAYWGLTDKPFENTPDPRFLFHSEELRDLYTRLLYTLQSRHGAAMLTGDSGCGKTMVARSLLHELDASRTEIDC